MMDEEPNGTSASGEPDDVYPVLPPDPEEVEKNPPVACDRLGEILKISEKEESRFQFSLAEMLLLVGIVALFLGILGCFPREYAAGLAGLGALASLFVLILLKPTQPIVRLGWWIVLCIYAMMIVATILEAK